MRRAISTVLCVATTACGAALIAREHPEDATTKKVVWENGHVYCNRMAVTASSRATSNRNWGWVFAFVGVGATATGTAISLATEDKDWKDKMAIALLPTAGAAAIVLSKFFFTREKPAGELANASTTAGNETDPEKAAKKCNEALATWESSRDDAAAMVKELYRVGGGSQDAGTGSAGTGSAAGSGSAGSGSGK